MPLPASVRTTQRRIATLHAAYRRALAGLEAATDRRAEVLAEADAHVDVARRRVDQALAVMARQLSVPLAAELVGRPVTEVRRITRIQPQPDRDGAEQ